MLPPKIAKLSDMFLHIRPRGDSELRPPDFSGGVEANGVVDWDPKLDGILCGEATMSTSSDHHGERHMDGDEVLYLIGGRMRLWLERDDGSEMEVPLAAGEAVLVPCGVWHRLTVDEPSRFLFMGGGRTQIRLKPKAGAAP